MSRGTLGLTLGLAAIGCSPAGSDDNASDNEQSSQIEADLETAEVDLAGVTRLALTTDDRIASVAGELGTTQDVVLSAFTNSISTLQLVGESIDELGFSRARFSQALDGVPVVGGDIVLVRDQLGQIVAASGAAIKAGDFVSSPSILAASASSTALSMSPGADSIDNGQLVYVAGSNLSPTLSWQFEVKGQQGDLPRHDLVFVDALTGNIAARHPKIHVALNRQTTDCNSSTNQADFTLERVEGDGATGDVEVDTAHDSAGDVYTCLSELFGRDSYDNLGADLLSFVRFDLNLQNAFWTGQEMVYGETFAEADVATHEIGHGVTEFTAGLIYQNESGALNEGASDILMAICDVHKAGVIDEGTWLVGEDLPIGAIRKMDDPVADGNSRDHYSTRFTGAGDNGGVHFNSGIFNLFFVLLTEGGTHPRRAGEQEVEAIGIDKAAQIYYRALSSYMVPSTNFAAARVATEQAATDAFGVGSAEVISVSEAWFAVGVGGPPPARPEPPRCGDGNVDAGETCDDGNTTAGDGCDSVCIIEPDPVCGDGNVDDGEACDDGNTAAGDGCDATCAVEPPPTPEDEGGCSVGSQAPHNVSWLLLIGAFAFIRRRRRQKN